ncbi:hydroxymethylglutaryl-CoA lyase [Amycolatopsis sp. WGS_07]|uniref:hydroxymethylglutaryl-CoA lyase n=1 Tax=Amycolatopsis sp. WGS_07 TaxID=3076764 RepID=UPI00387386FD
MNDATIRDVTLRDGLQLVRATLPTADKVALARFLLAAGVPEIEIGAVVRPDRVPAMADTLEVIGALDAASLGRSWVWVPNSTGVRKAAEAGAKQVQYVLSVSESHNQANVGRSVRHSMDDLAVSAEYARSHGVRIQLGLATAFTCPFEGRTPEGAVLDVVEDSRSLELDSLVLCDTIGQADPAHVARLTAAVRSAMAPGRLVFHGHDTWGLGVANTLAALEAGADTVDAALGGLGGCPFAPGASGNTALEDVLYALRPSWLTPARFRELLARGRALLEQLGEPERSRAADGASRSPGSHPWALAATQ